MQGEVSSVYESALSATHRVDSLCQLVWEAADLKGHQCSFCDHSPGVNLELQDVSPGMLSSVQNILRPEPPAGSLTSCHCRKEMAVEHPRSHHVKMKAAALGLSASNGHYGTVISKLKYGRHLKSPCPEICSRCEIPKLNEDERKKIFDNFWSLTIRERQWMFLLGSMKLTPLKKKSALPGSKKEKLTSRSYYFLINGTRRRGVV